MKKEYLTPLHTNNRTHGLYDKNNDLVRTGIMRSFLIPNYTTTNEEIYNHISHKLNSNKNYGIIKAQLSEQHPDMNIVAIFDILSQ